MLEIQGQSFPLQPGEYTPWMKLTFRAAPGSQVSGIARFLLTETEPHVSLYVSPIQIDPENPALPISHPSFYAAYLAKLLGTYATLGMAEDTWALNEGVIDEADFLKQAYLLLEEREAMFQSALERTRRGVVACVFDTSDRVQHMFYRHLEAPGAAIPPSPPRSRTFTRAWTAWWARPCGTWMRRRSLFVLSDHGFCSFRRGVNLNAWLPGQRLSGAEGRRHGERSVFPGRRLEPHARLCAWTWAALYLNIKGREASGIVNPGSEAEALKRELIARLANLRDEECDDIAIRTVYASSDLYKGPYLDEAPDLIIGYNDGYRTSWDAAVGKVSARLFEDNAKAWSGDHSVDPLLVPGVLFSNRPIDADGSGHRGHGAHRARRCSDCSRRRGWREGRSSA